MSAARIALAPTGAMGAPRGMDRRGGGSAPRRASGDSSSGANAWVLGQRPSVVARPTHSHRAVSPRAIAASLAPDGPDKQSDGGAGRPEVSESGSVGEVLAVFTVELGLMAMGIVDTLMVGHVGEAALAAASLGGITTWLVIITTSGSVGSLDPLSSQAHGAGDAGAVATYLRHGVRAATFLSLLGGAVMQTAHPIFVALGQPAAHAAAASQYCHTEAWGILPILLFQTFRLSLAGTNKFAALVAAVTAANVVNVTLNKIFIDGVTVGSFAGLPGFQIQGYGLVGAAWSTVFSRWTLFFLILWFAAKPLAERKALQSVKLALTVNPFSKKIREDWVGALDVLRRGAAIGAQMFVEFGAFAAMSLMAGRCGVVHAAGHAIIQVSFPTHHVPPLRLPIPD